MVGNRMDAAEAMDRLVSGITRITLAHLVLRGRETPPDRIAPEESRMAVEA